jgi:hypothetical protein
MEAHTAIVIVLGLVVVTPTLGTEKGELGAE